MTAKTFNLHPLEKLLREEDPLEIAQYLDEMMLILVQHSDNDGYLEELGHRYYILRVLRDAFYQIIKSTGDGN